jgi:hypothetical protein
MARPAIEYFGEGTEKTTDELVVLMNDDKFRITGTGYDPKNKSVAASYQGPMYFDGRRIESGVEHDSFELSSEELEKLRITFESDPAYKKARKNLKILDRCVTAHTQPCWNGLLPNWKGLLAKVLDFEFNN